MPCPICDTPRQEETLKDDWRHCSVCGYNYRLDERGELAQWQTTNHVVPGRVSRIMRVRRPT